MCVVVMFLGTLMDLLSIMMITLPIFMPIVQALGFDPVWFGMIMLVNLEMGCTSPPFGTVLFVMKGVAPPDTTMADIYKAGLPFLICDAISIALIISFPVIALWLPGPRISLLQLSCTRSPGSPYSPYTIIVQDIDQRCNVLPVSEPVPLVQARSSASC